MVWEIKQKSQFLNEMFVKNGHSKSFLENLNLKY